MNMIASEDTPLVKVKSIQWKTEPCVVHIPNYEKHHGNERAYLRDILLGVNDGLISTLFLTIAIFAGGMPRRDIVLTILSSSIGGSFSMGLGEYLATKSQLEVTQSELELEKCHIRDNLEMEIKQVEEFLETDLRIRDKHLINLFLINMRSNPEGLFAFMKTVEFGITDEDTRSPLVAMALSGLLYFGGSLPSLLSFMVSNDRGLCFDVCIILNILALFFVGVGKLLLVKKNWLGLGLENLVIGAIAGSFSYGTGCLFSQWIL